MLCERLVEMTDHLNAVVPPCRQPAACCGAGSYFAIMFEDILTEMTGFDTLSLADNRLSDASVARIAEGLRHNVHGLKIRYVHPVQQVRAYGLGR